MDRIGRQILEELTQDSQQSFLSIAKKIGVTPKTVQMRYKKMKEEGVLLHSSIVVSLSKLGYKGKAYLMIKLHPGKTRVEAVTALKKIKNVFLITEVMGGDCDLLALAAIRDYQSILNLVFKVRELPSVAQVDVNFTDETSFPVDKSFNKLLR